MNRLYLIIGVLVAIFLFGLYEYRSGYNKRDAEMQAEIAVKNEESREKERVLNENVIGSLKRFKIIADRYRNRRKRFALRFNLIAGIYSLELVQ